MSTKRSRLHSGILDLFDRVRRLCRICGLLSSAETIQNDIFPAGKTTTDAVLLLAGSNCVVMFVSRNDSSFCS